jgi:peptide-methionine (S)-S-oxide reductase
MNNNNLSVMTVGAGCFWCIETIFKEVMGVEKVVSGYTGGNVPGRPTYREICSGLTGHAEVIQLHFNPEVVSYEDLMVIFMTSHDPTTLNRQGADAGTQYRSVVYYHDAKQKEIAAVVAKEIAPYYDTPIVTEISPIGEFFEAESAHQDYYANNQTNGYCTVVINPKLAKLQAMHGAKLKRRVAN